MTKIKSELESIKGIGPTTIEKLDAAGVGTIMALAVSSPVDIATTAGMSESAARKIIKEARENLNLGFELATEYSKKRDVVKKISLDCESIDGVLHGGFESGCISEVFGQYGCGKTQIAHLLVVRALVEDPNNKCIYIDTEGTFRADRIRDFASANGLDPEETLGRIYVTRAFNSDHQMLLAEEAERLIQKDNNYRVLVVDSLTSHFRSEFIGRGELATRQQKLNKHMHLLSKIAHLYNAVVLVTNQVMSDPAGFFGDPTRAVGGHIVGHNSAFRIYLRPGKSGTIYFKLIDSPNLPQGEGNYIITKDGLESA